MHSEKHFPYFLHRLKFVSFRFCAIRRRSATMRAHAVACVKECKGARAIWLRPPRVNRVPTLRKKRNTSPRPSVNGRRCHPAAVVPTVTPHRVRETVFYVFFCRCWRARLAPSPASPAIKIANTVGPRSKRCGPPCPLTDLHREGGACPPRGRGGALQNTAVYFVALQGNTQYSSMTRLASSEGSLTLRWTPPRAVAGPKALGLAAVADFDLPIAIFLPASIRLTASGFGDTL